MTFESNQLIYTVKATKLYESCKHSGVRISLYSTMNKHGSLYKKPKLEYSFTIIDNTMVKDFTGFVQYINRLHSNLKKQIEKDKL